MKSFKKTLKGTVLFTVVSVLSLVIIFLTSALVLAAAANNRAHKSYSSSQASYTARSAIDSVLAAVSYDTDFAKAVAGIGESSAPVVVGVDMDNPGMGKITQAKLSYSGKKRVYDPETFSWVEKKIIAVTADVELSGETTSVTSYVMVDPVAPPPKTGGAGFFSQGAAQVSNHTCALGGTYLGLGIQGAGEKDYTDLYSNNLSSDTPPGYLTGETYTIGSDDVMQAPVIIDGNFITDTQTDFYFQKPGDGFEIWGDYSVTQLNSVRCYTTRLSASDFTKFAEIPHIYVDGDMNLTCGCTMKLVNKNTNENVPFNIFCGSLQIDGAAIENEFYADIYCMDPGVTSKIVNKGTKLQKWTSSVADGTLSYDSFGGNVYSRGNIEIDDAGSGNDKYFAKDLRVVGDVTIGCDVKVDGDLVVGGTLTLKDSATLDVKGTLYCSNISDDNGNLIVAEKVTVNGNYTLLDADKLKDGYTVEEHHGCVLKGVTVYESEWYKPENMNVWVTDDVRLAYGLNTAIDSTTFFQREESKNNVSVYDGEGKTIQKTDIISYAGDWDEPKIEYVYKDPAGNEVTVDEAYDKAGWYDENNHYLADQASATTIEALKKPITEFTGPIYPDYATKEVILNKNNTSNIDNQVVQTIYEQINSFNFSQTPTLISKVSENKYTDISQVPLYTGQATITDDVRFTATTPNSLPSDVVIEPDGHDIIVVVDGCTIKADKNFIIDDTMSGDVKFFINGNVTFEKVNILTKSFKAAKDNGTEISIYSSADIGTNSINPPNVYIYGALNSVFYAYNNFQASAYFEAPYTDFKNNAGATMLDASKVTYDDLLVSNTSLNTINIIGCFDVKSFNSIDGMSRQNNFGVLYMDPNSSASQHSTYSDAMGAHKYESVQYVCN